MHVGQHINVKFPDNSARYLTRPNLFNNDRPEKQDKRKIYYLYER